jgi:hypothetical protein
MWMTRPPPPPSGQVPSTAEKPPVQGALQLLAYLPRDISDARCPSVLLLLFTPHQLQQDPEGRGVKHPHPSPEAQGVALGAGTLQQGPRATAAGSSGALGGTALKQPTPNVTTTGPGRGCSRDCPPTYTGSTAASDVGLLSRLAEHACTRWSCCLGWDEAVQDAATCMLVNAINDRAYQTI